MPEPTDGKRGEPEAPGVTLVLITPKVLTQQATQAQREQRPRQALDWRTPAEGFAQSVALTG